MDDIPANAIDTHVDALRLVDHHCHGVVTEELDRAAFEALLGEGGAPAAGATNFDTALGLAVRRHCAPALGLPAHSSPDDYLGRRAEIGATEVNRRLLAASGTGLFLVDTGLMPERLTDPAELALLAGLGRGAGRPIIRLEALAESVAAARQDPDAFADRFAEALPEVVEASGAVGVKSIAAYRCGLALPGQRPTRGEVRDAARRWFADDGRRLQDPVLAAHTIWTASDHRLPIQLHVGLGDRDVHLHRSDPTLLTDLLHHLPSTVPVLLLHCYPFIRQAAHLAAVYPNVYLDLGLTLHHVGPARAAAIVAEALELAPFGKLLYSSDAVGLAELYFLGALTFRRGLAEVLRQRVVAGEWSGDDAERCARMIAHGNAIGVYGLDASP
jgi:predicted TIM-barrel fold metal-dependent hydrolase